MPSGVPHEKWTPSYRLFGLFILRRGDIPQRGLTALTIVEELDVLEDRLTHLPPCGEVRMVNEFAGPRATVRSEAVT